jgi:hypothetical protein
MRIPSSVDEHEHGVQVQVLEQCGIEAAPCTKRTTEQQFALSFGPGPALPSTSRRHKQIASKAGTKATDCHFVQLLKKYLEEGGDRRCTTATAAKLRKQYELV